MLACLKPGGLLVLAGPTWPSAVTELPNMAMNAPPHHLSWWSPRAFTALAARRGLDVLEARELIASEAIRRVYYWPHRLAPRMPPDAAFRHGWGLHARTALAWALAPLLTKVFGPGPPGLVIDAILIARKPEVAVMH